MELLAKKKRISVWVLVFTLILSLVTTNLILPVRATGSVMNGVGEAVSDVGHGVGEAVSDVGHGVGEAVSDVGNGMSGATGDMANPDNGKVSDSDGIIGNEGSETGKDNTERGGIGWVALVITLIVVLIVIVLIILLIPKKRDR